MAGNIVKWWKHKILGGYKQFSVQECTTDSEELMYHQVRAPSSCSAPPDLLLVSDRENNIPLKSPRVNIISATSPSGSASQQKHQHQHHPSQLQHQQQQQIPAHSTPKDVFSKNSKNSGGGGGGGKMHQQPCGMVNGKHMNGGSHGAADAAAEQGKDERIHLEEFTCDVSVESGKSSQPLQFSFTFYDLDGHHGKITKDDIVGIVYTIYESIGKSVVVPHCGSKTINVRLTVSPEGKSKAAAAAAAANSAVTTSKFRKGMPHSMRDSTQHTAHGGHSRRQHRYRPRKLVKTDDEDDDSTSEKEAVKKSFSSSKAKYCPLPPVPVQQPEVVAHPVDVACTGHENIYENMTNLKEECKRCLTQQEKSELYLKQASSRVKMLRKARKQKYQDHCHETRQRSLSVGNESCWKIRANNLIKTHNITHSQQQHQIDNNTQTQLTAEGATAAATSAAAVATTSPDHHSDCVDGMVGGSSHNTHSQVNNTSAATATAECWNNALNRNDLIDIIRESMEKNRLCFQSNGKPQANVSPIRHRQRSNTVSKIPTSTNNIISTSSNNNNNNNNHHPNPISNITSTTNNIINNNNTVDSTPTTHHQQQHHESNHSHSHHHLQPHIPIYHQQMAINPAVLAAQNGIVHSKMNLCGYDSFLHATICSGGTNHSPPPSQPNTATPNAPNHPQPVATVQPIMTSSPKIYISNQVKTSKILRNTSSSHHHHHSQQNSPQFQGYHRLSSSGNHSAAKLNISLLNALSPNLSNQEKFHQTIEHVEKWLTERDRKLLRNASGAVDEKSKKDVKNYDNLLFAKLTEKLQQQQLLQDTGVTGHGNRGSGNKENIRRMHNSQNHNVKMHHRQRSSHQQQQQQQQSQPVMGMRASSTSGSSGSNSEKFLNSNSSSKYVTLIPINGDPLECVNLLHQTSDDESSTVPRTPTPPNVASPTVTTPTMLPIPLTAAASASAASVAAASSTTTTSPGATSIGTNAAAVSARPGEEVRSSSSTSSLIHRYVHEHIHHHYHHFENKED